MTDAERMLAEIDALAGRIAGQVLRVQTYVESTHHEFRYGSLDAQWRQIATDRDRWTEIGREQLQQGLMALRRAVAPQSTF